MNTVKYNINKDKNFTSTSQKRKRKLQSSQGSQPVSSKPETENTENLFCPSPGLLPHCTFLTSLPVPSSLLSSCLIHVLKPKDHPPSSKHTDSEKLHCPFQFKELSSYSLLLMSSNWPYQKMLSGIPGFNYEIVCVYSEGTVSGFVNLLRYDSNLSSSQFYKHF